MLNPGKPVFGLTAWLVLAALLAHIGEEWPRFPEWATRHFGTTTSRWYAISHVIIVALVAWLCSRAAIPTPSRATAAGFVTVIAALAANTLFHVASTLAFAEYSPGLGTALLYVPLLLVAGTRAAQRYDQALVVRASVAGLLLSAAITATMWIKVPV